MSSVRSALLAVAATVVMMSTPVLTAAAAATAHGEVKRHHPSTEHPSKDHQVKDHQVKDHQVKDHQIKGPKAPRATEAKDHHSTKGGGPSRHGRVHHKTPVNDEAKSQENSQDKRAAPDNAAPGDAANWSARDWSRATAQWARKNKDKWDDCQKQSKDQGLTGRRNRTFLATCMST